MNEMYEGRSISFQALQTSLVSVENLWMDDISSQIVLRNMPTVPSDKHVKGPCGLVMANLDTIQTWRWMHLSRKKKPSGAATWEEVHLGLIRGKVDLAEQDGWLDGWEEASGWREAVYGEMCPSNSMKRGSPAELNQI